MYKSKLLLSNKKEVFLFILALFALFTFSILLPLWFINYLIFSGVGHFFSDNILFSLFSVAILFYFMIIGVYYYRIYIDPYVIQVTSFRPIFDFFNSKDYVDIPHSMLSSYVFFNRPLSFNKTLVIRIKSKGQKIIIRRFNFSFISNNKIQKLRSSLDRIIANNN